MRRHTEDPRDLIDLELPCFQKLRLFRGNGDRRIFHPLFEYGHLICVMAAAEGGLPALPHPGRVLNRAGMFQHTARLRAVGEELRPVFLAGYCHADGVLCHGDGRIPHQTVKAKAGDVQHLRGRQDDRAALHRRRVIHADRIFIIELPFGIPLHAHPVRHQRVQPHDLAFPIADDLCVGVAPQEQVRHQRFTEYEGSHLRVRLVME